MKNTIVKFEVKPEHREELKQALKHSKVETEKEAGNVEVKVFTDNNNPNIFFAYERWENQEAIDKHHVQCYTQDLLSLAEKTLVSPPEFYFLGETNPLPDHGTRVANPEDEVFIIFFIFKLKEGYRERLLKQFEKHIVETRKEAGNIIFDLFTVNGQEDTLAVYEHWRKESDVWDVHFKQPYAEETGALMHEAVVGELEQYMNFVTEF